MTADAAKVGQTVEPPCWSNGTEYSMWEANWCGRCWHDRAARKGEFENGCVLIALGMLGDEVPQWVYSDKPYPMHVHCLQFTPDDNGGDEGIPTPEPTPPGQEAMFDPGEFDLFRLREAVSADA